MEGSGTKKFPKPGEKNKEKLKCIFANIRSIKSKIDELRQTAEITKADVILLTETWTNPDMQDAEISIEGYNILSRCDRQDTTSGRGGGIIAYI